MVKKPDNVLVGLDLGTTKVCAIVGEVKENGQVDIIGIGISPSHGLKKGVVVNIDSTVESIKKAVQEAELMAGVEINSVYVGISGNHIKGINSRGVVAIKNKEVGPSDMARVIDAARAVNIPTDQQVLHVLPQEFIIDDQDGIKDPLGMFGVRLEAKVHIITGALTSIQNIIKSCSRAGLHVNDLVLQPLASSRAVLTAEEQNLGVVVVDIGGGTTDVALFLEGSLWHTEVLPIGGNHLTIDYDVTLLPPKKYFLPQYETLMAFDLSHPFSVERPEYPKKKVIVGVHPYDIIAIRQMDSYFLDTDVSESYLRRRKNTVIVGCAVKNVQEKAFFGRMNTGNVRSGYDLFLTDLGNRVTIEVGTEEGERLLRYAPNVTESSLVDGQKVTAVKESAASKAMRGLMVKPQGWHYLLEKNYESPVWKEQADKCLACGTCTLVCPTCFCYDVKDDINLTLKSGERVRTWDGCLLRQFTAVASGEVFREDLVDRYRHRFHRKGRYLPDKLGFVACVGCGLCSSQCVPDIADPVNLINKLFESSEDLIVDGTSDALTLKVEVNHDTMSDDVTPLHLPAPATIKNMKELTEKEMYFEIALDSGKELGHQPGQFVEVSLFGTGEAPISVSSPPGGKTFELVVRSTGEVTNKLHQMKKGDKVGIRGPFGKGFDTEGLKGRNLLFIAGGLGLAPMRSFIKHVLNKRKDYGKVTILYGCKNPSELLFKDETEQWMQRKDIEQLMTVDKCPQGQCWDHDIGVITTLIPKVKFDPKNTTAIVVGPPVMYKFVIKDLLALGVSEDNIIVSLERRMKCGVGKCGHCQMSGVYVCKEGPVFNYKDIKDNPEAFK